MIGPPPGSLTCIADKFQQQVQDAPFPFLVCCQSGLRMQEIKTAALARRLLMCAP
jgi:hypothetical protein